jgi:hypothetical protein
MGPLEFSARCLRSVPYLPECRRAKHREAAEDCAEKHGAFYITYST